MSTKIWMSTLGRAVDPREATISVLDRGFLYGDSVYETLRTAGGRLVEYERHFDRLLHSAVGIGMELTYSADQIRDAIAQTVAAAGNAESRVRVIVTRGTGPLSLDVRLATDPVLIVIVQKLETPTRDAYERGISACLVNPAHNRAPLSGLKTGNYMANVLALRQAVEARGDDAILCNMEGAVTEGTTSNVFLVNAAGVVVTPCLESGLLSGITRALVIEFAHQLAISVEERVVWPAELRSAREIFLSSSVRGVMPVTLLDGEVVGESRSPGPVTRRLHDAYEEHLARIARSEV